MDDELTNVKDKANEIDKLKKELEETSRELTLAVESAREANASKNEFFSKMSFEIRTPLSAIINSAFLGPLQLEEGNTEKANYYFDIIHQYGTNLLEVVNKYLDLASIESGMNRVHRYVTDIHSYLKDLVEKYHTELDQKNQKVQIECLTKDTMLSIDKDLFDKLIYQILHNAQVYSPEGSAITIEILKGRLDDEEEQKEYLLISIKDQGPGIPESEIESIFGRFYQTSVRKTDVEGIGIGLSICKSIMEAHQGRIWAESSQGEGAKFVCAFPISNVEKVS